MYLFSKVKDAAFLYNDFHFYYTPIDCKTFSDFRKFIGSTILLALMTISNRRIVYYSSEAVTEEKGLYSFFKKIHERLLRKSDLILRIPRVYSKDRNKGLIKILKDKKYKGSKNTKIKYITDSDFRDFYLRNLDKEGIVKYDSTYRVNTVKEIEELFCRD